MDRQISDLINICRDLNSERGPERRKAAVKLKNVLSHTATKKALDKNHEYKQSTKNAGKMFTWESVFRSVCLYVTMETEELQNANQEVSRTTLNNRETRKQEISALVKYMIRSADKGCPKLKGSLLFDHIRKILHEDYTCESYGQDYCSILLKNVLSVRKYMVELNTKDWHELLFMFFKLFNDPDVKIDKLLLSQIIHSLVCGVTSQCDVRPKKVLSFFTEFFSRAK
ncbi:serine-protein kinase ATM-like [Mercenaria mercenaria]|uniref:serine-protein kinase ATM-like n=1 Tax=Mercenaria mercenaria TaxID=6596 RepID=UPI00234F66FE|nr:serine-protein kinase ATM-like [Mercenaria mercenaria]